MAKDERDILELLQTELDFLEKGGFTENLYAARVKQRAAGKQGGVGKSDRSDKSDKSDKSRR